MNKITIKDIAKRSGVSIATVSHVINKTRFVSDELKEKVYKVMEEADYHPNVMAGSLRRKKTKTIGLIVPDNANPLYAELAKAIENILFSYDFSLMLCNSEHNLAKELKYITVLRAKRVDGVIVIPAGSRAEHINKLIESGLPIVTLDRPVSHVLADTILIDHFQGIFDATEYLIKLGHERIAYIDKPFDLPHKFARLKGYHKALKKHGIKAHDNLCIKGGVCFADGARAMETLLSAKPPPTAVLAFDDVIAMGALRTIQDHGLRVPEDISLIGFDDMPLCSYTIPRLTTVHYPKDKMAEMACKLLLERIEGSSSKERNKIVLSPRLILRESTAPMNTKN
jgi:LacI family transcriptional regulator